MLIYIIVSLPMPISTIKLSRPVTQKMEELTS